MTRPRFNLLPFACALCVAFAAATAHAQLAPFANLVTFDTGYAGNDINAVSFRHNSLTSVEVGGTTYQFSAYYRNVSGSRRVTVARRTLGTTNGPWEVFDYNGTSAEFGDPNSNATDSHNTISIGVDGDGYMHMSWGMHNHNLIYRKSTAPVTNANPISFPSTNTPMVGSNENSITYPQFYNTDDGDLLFFYRNGASGNGNTFLNRYDTTTDAWSVVQAPLFDGISSSVNSYPNNLAFDQTGNLHYTWTDRSTPAFQTNHHIYYARSPDEGVSWTKMDGTPYTLPLLESTSELVVNIPENSTLINQTSMAIDQLGRPAVATWWAPGAQQGNHTRQYMLAHFDGAAWQTSQISNRPTEPMQTDSTVRDLARPVVMFDDDNRAIVVTRFDQRSDRVSVAYSSDRQNWTWLDLNTADMGIWEPTFDRDLWARENKLHLFYQPVGLGSTNSSVSVLEWDARAYFDSLGPPPLSVTVDRGTGLVTVTNPQATAVNLTSYNLTSALGQLSPPTWNSLSDQATPGWSETQALATQLAEAIAAGSTSLGAGQSLTLGRAFAGSATAFGVDGPADLALTYTAGGSPKTGTINYTGVSSNNLTLKVDPVSGQALLVNTSPFEVSIDGYTISSAAGSLSVANWSSLDDQNVSSAGWFEANPSATRLSELQANGSTLLAGGATYALGRLFTAGSSAQDLALQFLLPTEATARTGVVRYETIPLAGDFNFDGAVDAADYTTWRDGLGTTYTAADYQIWRNNFGATASSALATSNAVPEPRALIVMLAAIAALTRRR